MGVVRVYSSSALMNSTLHGFNSIYMVDRTTLDIAVAPDSPDSEGSEGHDAEFDEDNNPDHLGQGIITKEMRKDFVNDPLAGKPDRESELGFGGISPQIDPTLIPENTPSQSKHEIRV